MNKKEILFCSLISCACSPTEAAQRAGYKHHVRNKADVLLARRDIRDKIAEFSALSQQRTALAEAGLHRLAFGSVEDAVRLLFSTDTMPEDLDLYNVSEIKKGKNGVEIKFFDRQKALEKLCELAPVSQDDAAPFYQALDQSAKWLYTER